LKPEEICTLISFLNAKLFSPLPPLLGKTTWPDEVFYCEVG
jgi:hypothetical protein